MKRLLFYSEAWGKGGIETFILNAIPVLIENEYEVDIFSTWDWKEQNDAYLNDLGVKRSVVFHGYRPGQVRRLVEGPRGFYKQLSESAYDCVWINTMNGMGFQFAREAKRAGVPVRIVHSHNSDVGDGSRVIKRLLGNCGKVLWGSCSTKNIACSQQAGAYLFGKEPFEVLNNGIDIERFRYSDEKRLQARERLGIDSKVTLIGNIGRINSQKNPLFQVKVFSEYKKLDPTARYLMLGRGDMADEVRRFAQELGVSKDLIIHSAVADAAPYYCALDIFLMPSLFEGLPYASIEAQCSSTPVLSSKELSNEGNITNLAHVHSLKDPPSSWALMLRNIILDTKDRTDKSYADIVAESGFSVDKMSLSILKILDYCHL